MHLVNKISTKPFPGLRVKTFSVLILFIVLVFHQGAAQVIDDFEDGDFSTSPTWQGSTGNFIVNASSQLQLSASAAGTSWLSTAFDVVAGQNIIWEFYLKQSFDPSGANFSRFYLMSDQLDLSGPLNGYYLQFGEAGTGDAVELFRQTGTASASVCRARSEAIASAFALRVRVTRSNTGAWQLLIAYNADSTPVAEASGTDNTYELSSFSGLLCTYTITNAARFFYDDILFSVETAPDVNPPEVLSTKAITAQTIELVFSESLESASVTDRLNYFLPSLGMNPVTATIQQDQRTVLLEFFDAIQNGSELALHIEHVRDLAGNTIPPQDISFLFFFEIPIAYGDVIINEILADPLPQIGLPAAEFVELYNRSPNPIQLLGWTFSDGTSSAKLPEFILQPGNFVIVCSAGNVDMFSILGSTLAVTTLPTLNNSGDLLMLMDRLNTLADSLSYDATWYRDEDKGLGGWTLERIDPENACDMSPNWSASNDSSGGTPGKRNSVYQSIPDVTGPVIIQVIQLSDSKLELVFNEKLSQTTPAISDFAIDPQVAILNVSFSEGSRSGIILELASVLDSAVTYRINASNIYDCPGNLIQPDDGECYLNKDETAPVVMNVHVVASNEISILFSEVVSSISAKDVTRYNVPGIGNPGAVQLDSDGQTLQLTYATKFTNGKVHTLKIEAVSDLAGNLMRDTVLTFLYFKPAPVYFKDVIFTEIFADPSPPVNLPEREYVELYNRSANAIDLTGWTMSDERTSATFGHFILLPGEYAIGTSAQEEFSALGTVLPVTLPSLNNARDVITVKDHEGNIVDSVAYTSTWYDSETSDGGWSLELIDPANDCAGARNWTVSESTSGGTPGEENSVRAELPDNTGPVLLSAVAADSLSLTLTFSEALEKQVPSWLHVDIQPKIETVDVQFTDANLEAVTIRFATPLVRGTLYRVEVKNVYDCAGNALQNDYATAVLILAEQAIKGDVVINELLFNPMPQGGDFVEVYNRSPRAIDLKDWTLATEDDEKGTKLAESQSIIFPGEYRVFTEDANRLKGEYLAGHEETFRETKLPPLNDDAGTVILRDNMRYVIDSVSYTEDYHSAFVREGEGISLERISTFLEDGGDNANWRSASSQVGFATPGYANSNARTDIPAEGAVTIDPEVIQPDLQAASFALIRYRFEQSGLMANVKVFDQRGRPVRHIAANELLGTEGFFRWDGDLDNGSAAAVGYYLVWFEVFSADGMIGVFRKRLAVF